jgi:hypothetical protein
MDCSAGPDEKIKQFLHVSGNFEEIGYKVKYEERLLLTF